MTQLLSGIGPKAALLLIAAVLVVTACSGPTSRDDQDPTATGPVAEAGSGENPENPEETPAEPTETVTPTEPDETATPTEAPTVTPTPTEAEPTSTPTPEPTATPLPVDLEASLPTAEQIPGGVYLLANQGTRSALELAEGYADSSSHLVRLDEWGFQEHHFREFSRDSGDESLPNYVLVTVNLYGSPEQADEAISWLESLNASQGHTFVDPPPDIGENAIASSVETAEGVPTSIVFTRYGPRVYAVFAQGGEPEPFVLDLARQIVEQLDQSDL